MTGRQLTVGRSLMVLAGLAAAGISLPALAGSVAPQPKAGDPLDGLTSMELSAFEAGRVQFERTFTDAEGLGPIFNQNSCASCHNNPVGGSGSIFVTRFGLSEKGGFDPLDAFGGSLLQANAIDEGCLEVVPMFANVTSPRITSSVLGAGLVLYSRQIGKAAARCIETDFSPATAAHLWQEALDKVTAEFSA